MTPIEDDLIDSYRLEWLPAWIVVERRAPWLVYRFKGECLTYWTAAWYTLTHFIIQTVNTTSDDDNREHWRTHNSHLYHRSIATSVHPAPIVYAMLHIVNGKGTAHLDVHQQQQQQQNNGSIYPEYVLSDRSQCCLQTRWLAQWCWLNAISTLCSLDLIDLLHVTTTPSPAFSNLQK